MLELAKISKTYGDRPVLQDIDITITQGEVFSFLGHSGCGKTTLLRIIAGLETPDAGRVTHDGNTWAGAGMTVPPQGRNLGFVFQSYAIWPHLRVSDQIAYPLRNRSVPRKEIAERVAHALALVGLDGLGGRYPSQLSGGQQQRVAMARAIVAEPTLLLLDEPFSNLDVSLREQMRRELRDLQAKLGLTVLLVTHDQQDAFSLSDRIAVMEGGRIQQIAGPEEIYSHPANDFVRNFVGKSSALRAEIAADGRILSRPDAREVWLRPEDVTIEAATHDPEALTGIIQSRHYLGDRYECELRLTDGQRLIAFHRRGWVPPSDGRVALRVHRPAPSTSFPHALALEATR